MQRKPLLSFRRDDTTDETLSTTNEGFFNDKKKRANTHVILQALYFMLN